MTREEMLVGIDALRVQGHKIGIVGAGSAWECQFDEATGKGANPVEAYIAAKGIYDAGKKQEPTNRRSHRRART